MRWATVISACALSTVLSIQSAVAAPLLRTPSIVDLQSARPMAFGGTTSVPRGYYDLCRGGHAVCRQVGARGLGTDRRGVVILTDAALGQIASTNLSVNRGMRSRSDSGQHGVEDRWTVGGRVGDCEDFALTKKKQLMAAGWPSSALLVALARTPRTRQEHAVLVVRTDRGDLVLDNLTDRIRSWNRTGLQWTKVQSPSDTWVWHTL